MAINRMQIPSQIDPFEDSGGVTSQSFTQANVDELARLLMLNREAKKMDYSGNVEKYKTRLGEFVEPVPRMNIYDFASELGAGLLSTPNTGGASAYVGLGVGFNKVSERMRNARAEERKMRQQLGMQAAQMAMQDEQGALDYLRQIELKNIDLKNKRGDLLTFEYTDADGKVVQTTVRDNVANDDIINDLLDTKNAIEVKTPGSVVNVGTGASERDKQAIKSQYASEDEILAKSRAGTSSISNVNEAQEIARRLGPENFGEVERLTMYPRKLINSLRKKDSEIIGDQILLNQISMGFTMDIVSRTKGAISNREMELFIQASPGLGSNYNGFMKQASYLKRIAQRDVDFFNAYVDEADRLEGLEIAGEMTASQVKRKLNQFEGNWYNDNLIFDAEEKAELEAISKGGYVDSDGFAYNIADEFNPSRWAKEYREGQETENPSSYTTNQSPQLKEALNLKEQVASGTGKFANLTDEERTQKLAEIDAMIKGLSGQ
jgi:co-chaperonin GroES (HSP10)